MAVQPITPGQVHALSLGWNRVLVAKDGEQRVTTDGEFRRSLAAEGWRVQLTRADVAAHRARLKNDKQPTTDEAIAASMNSEEES